MNERIKLLAEQAGLNYHNWITNESNINDGDFKYPRLEDYEKFAELIVQECIDIIAPYTVIMSRPGEEYLHPILEIKKHFGVEE
jgi:hypothetical protein